MLPAKWAYRFELNNGPLFWIDENIFSAIHFDIITHCDSTSICTLLDGHSIRFLSCLSVTTAAMILASHRVFEILKSLISFEV